MLFYSLFSKQHFFRRFERFKVKNFPEKSINIFNDFHRRVSCFVLKFVSNDLIMPTFAKTQKEYRKSVCIICMKKGDQELSKTYKVRILQLVQKDVNFNNKRVPLTTCVFCRSNLSKLCSKLYNFEIIAIKPLTCFSTVCECLICKISKLRGKEKYLLSRVQNLAPKVKQ